MTGYCIVASGGDIGIKAVTYAVRIVQIIYYNTSTTNSWVDLYRHEGSTLSGGTATAIAPLRTGSPAATALAQVGTLTLSGATRRISTQYLDPGSTATADGPYVIGYSNAASASFDTPISGVVAQPGQVIRITGVTSVAVANIYFEELRIPGTY